jgi:hypothetical protein
VSLSSRHIPPRGSLVQPLRRHRHPGELPEHGPQGPGRLPLGRHQPPEVPAQLLGQGQQGQRPVERRHVDDDQIMGLGQHRVPQRPQQTQLLGPGQRRDLIRFQPGSPE